MRHPFDDVATPRIRRQRGPNQYGRFCERRSYIDLIRHQLYLVSEIECVQKILEFPLMIAVKHPVHSRSHICASLDGGAEQLERTFCRHCGKEVNELPHGDKKLRMALRLAELPHHHDADF